MKAQDDMPRLAGDLIRFGVVTGRTGDRCTVQVGDIETGDIPWICPRAGSGLVVWSPPSEGEQGLLLCPEGEIEAAVFVPGVLSTAVPAPDDGDNFFALFGDGARFSYDPATGALAIELPAGGTGELTAPGGLTLNAETTIVGDVHVTGAVDATGDVTADGISLKTHVHGNVETGAGQTGAPQ